MNKRPYDVILLTESRFVHSDHPNQYLANILEDDAILTKALESHGLKVGRFDWADESVNWGDTKVAIFRTTWNYHKKIDAFFKWFEETKKKCILVNDYETAVWNLDKVYLWDLKNKGVKIVPSLLLDPQETKSLGEHMKEQGWAKAILKPTVSAAARETYKIDSSNLNEIEKIYINLKHTENFMLQEFQENVLKSGEISHMVFNGKHTHSILKLAKPGDFRVQDDFGGSVHVYDANAEEITLAEDIVKASGLNPMYARVDVMRDNKNQWVLGELELIEPELWFRKHPPAAQILAKGIFETYFK